MTNTQIFAVSALAIATFALGYVFGSFNGSPTQLTEVRDSIQSGAQTAADALGGDNSALTSEMAGGNSGEVAFTIRLDSLSEAQQAMVRGMGIDSNEIQVTYGMVACAEAEIGAARVEEIRNGAAPSMTEGVKLMGCYR